MNLAVIKTGGKQYKVAGGQELNIEKLEGNVGDKIKFDQVLLITDEEGEKFEIGQPILKEINIEAEIVEQGRAKKVSVIKYKRKVRYRRNVGHRQPFTKVKFGKI